MCRVFSALIFNLEPSPFRPNHSPFEEETNFIHSVLRRTDALLQAESVSIADKVLYMRKISILNLMTASYGALWYAYNILGLICFVIC